MCMTYLVHPGFSCVSKLPSVDQRLYIFRASLSFDNGCCVADGSSSCFCSICICRLSRWACASERFFFHILQGPLLFVPWCFPFWWWWGGIWSVVLQSVVPSRIAMCLWVSTLGSPQWLCHSPMVKFCNNHGYFPASFQGHSITISSFLPCMKVLYPNLRMTVFSFHRGIGLLSHRGARRKRPRWKVMPCSQQLLVSFLDINQEVGSLWSFALSQPFLSSRWDPWSSCKWLVISLVTGS